MFTHFFSADIPCHLRRKGRLDCHAFGFQFFVKRSF